MVHTYKQIDAMLRNHEPFRGNSLTGEWRGETFVVISYETIIAAFTPGNMPVITSRKYSVTTSKQTSRVRFAWRGYVEHDTKERYGEDIVKVSRGEIEAKP